MSFFSLDWSVPENISFLTTTRNGGVSKSPFDQFNLAFHVNDDSKHVIANRALLHNQLPAKAIWLAQIHSNKVIEITADSDLNLIEAADALYTKEKNIPLAIMTADCLPIFLTDIDGTQVGAIHAGWRGLSAGIIESTLACFSGEMSNITACFGPAIGPDHFEVGEDVVAAFSQMNIPYLQAFKATKRGKYLANIFLLAQLILNKFGITCIANQQLCTFSQSDLFYSYRRENLTGRMASIIWITQ
ncbi:peptidoglycan editing factor PgeF [Pseudoalteromonas denitrificans]|uniref:Purine nucleoside phosphorylase n=1 Tax=Pseudoalteromonas denitrificans DSM 6059 TaxID=1123010 RepID=A0A1I1MLT3_9GAMM|nr:peptidoglycan editing factor PgeF [Pseudoalteromonas denitrificans]SFC86046.1 conserved hypothetical protein [Pseudoalteromonas denitrificans DSM 6059]